MFEELDCNLTPTLSVKVMKKDCVKIMSSLLFLRLSGAVEMFQFFYMFNSVYYRGHSFILLSTYMRASEY